MRIKVYNIIIKIKGEISWKQSQRLQKTQQNLRLLKSRLKDSKQEFETIEALLIHVQSQLKFEKDIENGFGGFSYYTIDNMLKQIRSALIEHGAFGRFSTTIEQKGERYYVQASFKVSYKGQTFEEVAEIREPVTKPKMDDSQVTRSATTQAKKTLTFNSSRAFL